MSRKRARNRVRLTPLDLAWPGNEVRFGDLAREWGSDAFGTMLGLVWKGYNELFDNVLRQMDINQADDELERSITQILEPRIQKFLSGNEPWYIQHGPYEYATRKPSPAQPPQYDIAFVLRTNPKIMWPLEAKVLRTDGAVASYVQDIQQEFVTGRYAPYVKCGAMLGYLLRGSPDVVFRHLSSRLGCCLRPLPEFDRKWHQVSVHYRALANPEFLSGPFLCHHLIMKIFR